MTVPARLRQWARRLLGVDAASAERDVARIRLEVKRALGEIRGEIHEATRVWTAAKARRLDVDMDLARSLHSLAAREVAIRFETELDKRVERVVTKRLHEIAAAHSAVSRDEIRKQVATELEQAIGRRLYALFGVGGSLSVTMTPDGAQGPQRGE